MRVNISLKEELLPLIEEEAKRLHLSRSAFISLCCTSSYNINSFDRIIIDENTIEDND